MLDDGNDAGHDGWQDERRRVDRVVVDAVGVNRLVDPRHGQHEQ